jgi:sulfur-oxidizing protein SoxY
MPIHHPRRGFLLSTTGLVTCVLVHPSALLAQDHVLTRLVAEYANGAGVREGRVKLDIAKLVDNGNSVPIEVAVDSPMTANDHVVGIAVFNEKNPQHDVALFALGPNAGRARVATRVRLATTQKLVAVAKLNDGSCWTHTVEVIVTLAACIEDE